MTVRTPTSQYLFTEGTGNAVSTYGGYTLTPDAGTSWDAANNRIKGPFSGALGPNAVTDDWSFAFDLRVDAEPVTTPTVIALVSKSGQPSLIGFRITSRFVRVNIDGTTPVQSPGGSIPLGNNFKVAFTHQGGTSTSAMTRIYINGVEVKYSSALGRFAPLTNIAVNLNTMDVGKGGGDASIGPTSQYAYMDTLRAWNVALTPAEVAELHGAAIPKIQLMAFASATLTASRSPSVTFTGYTPADKDLVLMTPVVTGTATITVPSGWTNMLSGNTDVESGGSNQLCAVTHRVTAAEQTAVTQTYSPALLYDANATGDVCAMVLRGVDVNNRVDSIAAGNNSGSVTPHVLPGLTGSNLSTGSLPVAIVGKVGTGTYTEPTGWTKQVSSNVNDGCALLTRDTLTVAGTNISATNITPSASSAYVSLTAALSAIVGNSSVYFYDATSSSWIVTERDKFWNGSIWVDCADPLLI